MIPCTALVVFSRPPSEEWLRESTGDWAEAGVNHIILMGPGAEDIQPPNSRLNWSFQTEANPFRGQAWDVVMEQVATPVLLVVNADAGVALNTRGLAGLIMHAKTSHATVLYCDYAEGPEESPTSHPTIPYQLGSIRDDFDFGPVMMLGAKSIQLSQSNFGPLMDTAWAGWYDLRLRLSVLSLPVHIPETLYRCQKLDARPTGQQLFDYQDPRHRAMQIEMESVANAHLRRLGAFLEPKFAKPAPDQTQFPVEASVIIPVRNRAKTIAQAVRSALAQQTSFSFNLIVVDNHSTDDTTATLQAWVEKDSRVIHMIPPRTNLGIGGCWNLAVRSPQCGRIAVQLDSDDMYAGPDTLQRIVNAFQEGPYAMVVGSYRLVNNQLQDIPPGLIDHKEWTRENGRNNLLRVNGIGAPRAFLTEILRHHPLPNVNYGEDYFIALRLSREYEIGRIHDPIYLCRRWEGNSDADLTVATRNQQDTYKDRLRTLEIIARQQINVQGGPAEG